ncbi:MAG: polynucleotide adenylyltransferase/metal dependent phosphohydrolase [Candidatus Peregrinibacteria bacterium GW2011_GWE2_39_6]|nr:MAG: polynucleotide adenylyltransferase/metal dependent phosphohydrolase [Candidatus Peregrinibacteria bacterium GW2011_GWF2_39_17]KKR26350.1 MAG: polynucleotide adenylyltransferase/metal dependent phosphohydrolase [Candidatus Peregrinibacteria bacterium GW2011_GWE2_39_6]HCW32823.1 phosphohydrolase [Candidatus Peregrinibacteria bacterium]
MEKSSLKLVKILQKAGFETYLAGGCVRDMLLKKDPLDYDIATSAKPDEIEKLLDKTIPIGKKFGVILATENNHHFQIATFRSDSGYSDGRRPNAVTFTNAEEDAKRRDFTVNGLFYDPLTKKIYDYVEGQKDLEAHLIRFIGDPHQRILEDHLRILRAIRFKNTLHFQYHPDTYQALTKHANLANKVSGERMRDELNKMLYSEYALDALEDLLETGVLEEILPEVYAMKGVAQPYEYHHEGDVWEHAKRTLDSVSKYASLNLRWAAFLHDVGKPETFKLKERIRFDHHAETSAKMAKQILRRLKFQNRDLQHILWLIEHHMMLPELLKMPLGRQRHWFLLPHFKDLLALFEADISGTDPARYELYTKLLELYTETLKRIPKIPKPLLSGHEIMDILELKPGEKIGKIAQQLREKQLTHELNTKKQAKKWLTQLGATTSSS